MDGYILALDQGTTSCRALVFNRKGEIISSAQKEFQQYFPRSGWVEHDAEEIRAVQSGMASEALSRAGINPGQIRAIGITNQRETVVVWDRKTGLPVHRAVVWQSRQSAPICDRLKKDDLEPLFRERTGLVIDPYFSATKAACGPRSVSHGSQIDSGPPDFAPGGRVP